jgi:hypothetical protein
MDTVPPHLNKTLIMLGVLGMVQQNQKINLTDLSFVSATSWLGSCRRGLSGEGRQELLVELGRLFNDVAQLLDEYSASPEYRSLLLTALTRSKIGLTNLAVTYRQDPHTVSQIEIWQSSINIVLGRYSLDSNKIA